MSEKATLANCCFFQEGYVNPTQKESSYFGGGINWLRASDLNDGYVYETERTLSEKGYLSAGKSAKMFREDTIAISKSGTIGRLGILKAEMCGNRAVINIDVNPDKADLFYVFYTLNHKHREIISKAQGSIQKNLYISALKTITLEHGAIEEQKTIGSVLSAIDQKIELNNRINAQLEAMAKTLYDYWFVQFDFPDANGHPYKTAGGKMTHNPTLNRFVPDGWGVSKVGSLLSSQPIVKKIPNKDVDSSGGIPVIDQSQKFICGFSNDQNSAITPRDCHIVFGDHTRAVKLVNFRYARGADGTQILDSNCSRMPNYLFYQNINDIDLSSYGYARHFKFLKEKDIVLPTKGVAAEYQQYCLRLFGLIRTNIRQNHQLEQLRDWLLPMLMNGQVTVS